MPHPIVEQKTDKTMNKNSNTLNGSNTYDMYVLKWLCTKACETEMDFPWQNMRQWLRGKIYHPLQAQ
jgi:hypothetical protein